MLPTTTPNPCSACQVMVCLYPPFARVRTSVHDELALHCLQQLRQARQGLPRLISMRTPQPRTWRARCACPAHVAEHVFYLWCCAALCCAPSERCVATATQPFRATEGQGTARACQGMAEVRSPPSASGRSCCLVERRTRCARAGPVGAGPPRRPCTRPDPLVMRGLTRYSWLLSITAAALTAQPQSPHPQ